MNDRSKEPLTGYDAVAEEYAREFRHELKHKPFDREVLDRFAERVHGAGPVCDLGCGPGQVAAYLHARGVEAFGLDLSPEMVAGARREHPEIRFVAADLRAIPVADGAWAGIAAFYSLIHVPLAELTDALRELRRVVKPGGPLLLSFHIGDETVHRDELLGKRVSLDFHFFTMAAMQAALAEAGWKVEGAWERAPYEEVEYPSRRGYVLAHQPVSTDDFRFAEVRHGSAEYDALVTLRATVLRAPLGLTFSAEQLAAEASERHIGCYRMGELVGCLLLKDAGDGRVQMRQVAVRPEAQGTGIGRALVAYAEATAARLGHTVMLLHAREGTVGFYERLGYARAGERFFEVTLPHWEMHKKL